VPPTCFDGIKNGTETDIDCGGECPPCPDGDDCLVDSDCESGVCDSMICQAPTCEDGVQNGLETDVDCGGPVCPGCAGGERCDVDSDCESGLCTDGVCETPRNVISDDGLWVWRGSYLVDWRAHQAGRTRDRLKVRGWINPAGLRKDMAGTTLELRINDNLVVAAPLDSRGIFRSTLPTGDRVYASLDPKRGVYLVEITRTDLRDILPLDQSTVDGEFEVPIEIIIPTADTTSIRNRAEFFSRLNGSGSRTTGTFRAAREDLLDGVFIVKKVLAKFSSGRNAYRMRVRGWLTLDGAEPYAPTGDITVGLGGFEGVIPFADVRRRGSSDANARYRYNSNGDLRLFTYDARSLRIEIKTGFIPADQVNLVPMPPSDRTADLAVLLQSSVPGGRLRATSEVELVRRNASSAKWSRPGPVP
jgi:hypothetical protein